ncbi:abietadienol/abietadienal oxidase [Dendrobium catenatum]|uniref:Abietadienol/abietadienal oxidase n=1 Tax=Dendrobium catenatum TaxID=906689 RepID=A0A2I0WP27_9ASPA|nr:abietadienol/abietadienal oxidase [Dendrobium catenatum]PKU77391.1 Abietadienol/abietadienal oxidase [Dendrobium catenatum]
MEGNYLLLWSISIAALSCIFSWFYWQNYKKKKIGFGPITLPPGDTSWSAIIGDCLRWYNSISSSHPPEFVEEQVKRHGKVFTCSLFGRRAVVSADPVFNRYIMQNEGKLFQSSYPKSFRDLVGKNGVIVVHGEQQKKLHAIAVNIMKLEKISSNSSFLSDVQMIMLQTINSLSDNEVVVLQDVCRKVAINLMANQLMGVSSESEINEMACLFSDFVDGCLSVPINLPGFAYHTAMKAREGIIAKIKNTIAVGMQQGGSVERSGVLGRLVEEENLNDNQIADFIINLLFAGNETTTKTMLFAVYFLTQCPQALEELLIEHASIRRMNHNEILEWDDYKAMPFTQCVIDETLRLGGIAIWLLREAKADVEYKDFTIPQGYLVVPFLSAIHLDEGIYPEALQFNPWRWLAEENKEKRNWRTSPYFSPFGGGARYCPGAEISRLQIAFFLHHFVSKCRWTQIAEDRMSFFPSARLVNGFRVRISKV